jgi:hypothetical protein
MYLKYVITSKSAIEAKYDITSLVSDVLEQVMLSLRSNTRNSICYMQSLSFDACIGQIYLLYLIQKIWHYKVNLNS